MKVLKFGLRLWITLVSVASFVGGWIMLAHAPKPLQPTSATIPTLEPLPPLSQRDANQTDTQNRSFFLPQTRSRSFFPVFRTGGS